MLSHVGPLLHEKQKTKQVILNKKKMFALSIESLEVDLVIAPFFVIFLLMLLPVPFLSGLLARLVTAIEGVQFLQMSVLLLGSCLSFSFFAFSAYRNFNFYQVSGGRPSDHHALEQWRMKRRQTERNMYLHCLSFVLIAAVWKLARMNRAYTAAKQLQKTGK